MIRLILDTATLRVIYFTSDLNENLTLVDQTLMYDYAFVLPENFSLKNCWNWRLVGNRLELHEGSQKTTPDIFEKNKQEVLQLLETKINQARHPYLSKCIGSEYIRELKNKELKDDSSEFLNKLSTINGMSLDEYRNFLVKIKSTTDEILKITEINLEFYKMKINSAVNNHDLAVIRDEFSNADLTNDNTR